MKIKALWGWMGVNGHVRSGDVIEVDGEYGHHMIGKGLAVEHDDEDGSKDEKQAAPTANKQAASKETK